MAHWSEPSATTRFRVRVGKDEEFALPVGLTLVGRDASCPITVTDSLASRRHARIQCDGEQATVEDLGSRNGTRVNGLLISGPHALREGDRVGIGACELVIVLADDVAAEWRDEPTGLLATCLDCRFCFAEGLAACPRCGSTRSGAAANKPAPRKDETSNQGMWTLGMLLEMVGKAILVENASDAEKLMRRTAIIVGDGLRDGRPPSTDELRTLSEAARWLDKAQKNRAWTDWYERLNSQLSPSLSS